MIRVGLAGDDHRERTASISDMLCGDPELDRLPRDARMLNYGEAWAG